MALPSLPPSGPLVDEVYVFRHINAWEERRAVGRETWNLDISQTIISPTEEDAGNSEYAYLLAR